MPRRIERLRGRKIEFYQIALILFGIGIFAGIFLARSVYQSCPAEINCFFKQIAENMADGEREYSVLFQQIMGKQLKSIGLLLVFSISVLSLPYIGGFLLYKGCVAGFLFGSVLLQFGAKGLLLAVSLFFPHCFLYMPAYFSVLNKGYRFGMAGSQKELIKELPAVFASLALLLTGCILEAYGNTWILGKVFSVL